MKTALGARQGDDSPHTPNSTGTKTRRKLQYGTTRLEAAKYIVGSALLSLGFVPVPEPVNHVFCLNTMCNLRLRKLKMFGVARH